MREARDRERNNRVKDVGGINNDMNDTSKEMERDQDKSGTAGYALTSTEVEGYRIAFKINGLRERSKRAKTNQRAAVNRDDAVEVRDRDKAKVNRIHDRV